MQVNPKQVDEWKVPARRSLLSARISEVLSLMAVSCALSIGFYFLNTQKANVFHQVYQVLLGFRC